MPRTSEPRTTGRHGRARSTRSYLFSDLRGYTRYVEAHGDAAAAQMVRGYRSLVRREIARHEGREIETEGDSFFIVFDSASAALDCAVAIARRAKSNNEKPSAIPLRIGMGLHVGESIDYDGGVIGGAQIIAARLAAKAAEEEILISDTMRGLVRTSAPYELSDLGPLVLKGVREPIRAWTVSWDGERTARPEPGPVGAAEPRGRPAQLLCPVLVGRDAEMARLADLLARAARGEPGLALVSGEAGVGKSGVVRELRTRARDAGFTALVGTTLESDASLPYASFVSAIRSAYGQPDRLRKSLTSSTPDLVPLFPELGQGPDRPERAPSMFEQHRVAIAFHRLLTSLAQDAPLLVVLEDLHWADEATLALLQRLGRELVAARILVLGTYRSDELQRRHPLLRVLAALQRERHVTEVPLRRLSAPEIVTMIRETLAQAEPDVKVSDTFASAIFERSQGNPFFTEELLKSLVESGDVFYQPSGAWGRKPIDELQIPGSIREAVRQRLDRLSPPTRSTLTAAGVLGSRFAFDVLRSVREADDLELEGELREAIDQQLLVEVGDPAAPAYAFRHALTREVIYEDLLLTERRRLHLRAATALATQPDTPPSLLAQHWHAGGDRERAAAAHEAAAEAALLVYAPAAAVAHFEAAIGERGTATHEHHWGLARAYRFFDPLKAREAAEHALAQLPPAPEWLGRRLELMRIAADARWILGDSEGSLRLAREGVGLAEASADAPALAYANDWYATVLMRRGDDELAAERAGRALEAAKRTGDLGIHASALATIAATVGDRDPVAALEMLDDAASRARRAGTAWVMSRIHNNSLVLSFAVDPGRRRRVRIERAREFVDRYGAGQEQIDALHSFHQFVGGEWDHLTPPETPSASGNLYVDSMAMLGVLVRASRRGPSAEDVTLAGELAQRAIRQNEPQWAVPRVGYGSLVLAMSGRDEELVGRAEIVKELASRTADPALAMARLPRGFDTSAMLLCLTGDRDGLRAMSSAMEKVAGFQGEREALRAFIRALEDRPEEAAREFEASIDPLVGRGFPMTVAMDLYCIARRMPLAGPWKRALDVTDEVLGRAGAEWLAKDLHRLAGASARPAG